MNKVIGHLKTVLTHKRYVAKFCFMCGLYFQGIFHDMSKFSPTEFFESVKYWSGTRSPIDACKEVNGVSECWLHHRGRNKHHWEYWADNFESGIMGQKMPFKYALEMVCDFLGAGVAYNKGFDYFSMEGEYDWWQAKRQVVKMHPETKAFVDVLFTRFVIVGKDGIKDILGDKEYMTSLKRLYNHGEYCNIFDEYDNVKEEYDLKYVA